MQRPVLLKMNKKRKSLTFLIISRILGIEKRRKNKMNLITDEKLIDLTTYKPFNGNQNQDFKIYVDNKLDIIFTELAKLITVNSEKA